MNKYLTEDQLAYIKEHIDENIELLMELGRIPCPPLKEDRRARFIKRWLERIGAKEAFIDSAKNVVYPLNCDNDRPVTVIMAHMDIIFPDMQELPLVREGNKLFAPGIGDDTANVVQLLMCIKYIVENKLTPKNGVVLVINSGEEGLGNLKGAKAIVEAYKGRIKEFISLDGYTCDLTNDAVGSHRYRVTIKTEGGHSFRNYGNDNAIFYLTSMIQTLYSKRAPREAKTTYNVGTITGGTSVNSIAQEASMLYEFRSVSYACLHEMETFFNSVIQTYRDMGVRVLVEVVGIRPCKMDMNEDALKALTDKNIALIEYFTKEKCVVGANSTDANVPLSLGIPANTFGAIRGGRAHTRDEWVDLDSVEEGFQIALAVVLSYF